MTPSREVLFALRSTLLAVVCYWGWAGTDAQAIEITRVRHAPRVVTPGPGEVVRVSFTISEPAEVELMFSDRDGHLVAAVRTPAALPPGKHVLTWDGLDREHHPVARDAYTYSLKAKGKNGELVIWDLTQLTGGRRVQVSEPSWNAGSRELRYQLAEPARVRVRVSRENGQVLATIVDSAARLRGKHVEVWREAARAGIGPDDDSDLSFEFEAVTLSENTVVFAEPHVGAEQ